MSWLGIRLRKISNEETAPVVPDTVEQEIAALRDRATVVGAEAAQLGYKLSHLGAQIEVLDDELTSETAAKCSETLERQRSELDIELTGLARRVDAMLGERAGLLDQIAQLEQRYDLPVTRFHIVSDGMEDDRKRAERRGRRRRSRTDVHEQEEERSV